MSKFHITLLILAVSLIPAIMYVSSPTNLTIIHNVLVAPYMPVLKPFYWASGPLVCILVLFLLVPIRYFHGWLKYIASWYVPLAILVISQPEWYRVTIVDPTPAGAALIASYILAFLTILYIAIRLVVSRIRRT